MEEGPYSDAGQERGGNHAKSEAAELQSAEQVPET